MKKSHDRSARHAAPADPQPPATEAAATAEPLAADEAPAGTAGAPPEGEAGAGDDVASLRGELDAQRDRYLRLAAEFDNFRRRTQRERAEAGVRAKAELVRPLLDALDDLERFGQVDTATATAASITEAVMLVGRKLAKALADAGLEVVNPLDEPFDPARHEALATAPATSAEQDSTVAQVYQPGYVFGGQLLRPARVVVRQFNG
jgi:molecular chaperone GrpE